MHEPRGAPPGLSIEKLSFGYTGTLVFRDFSLSLGAENPVVILGPSGCGKTTLLRLCAGLLKPDAGTVKILNKPRASAELPAVSVVFQEPRLFPWFTALENAALPARRPLGRAAEDRARRFLELLGIAGKAGAYPAELSGGEKQRVAIARAFACPAPLILMDEPFQSLDIPRRIELMDLCLALLQGSGAGEDGTAPLLVAVTHDPGEAVYLGRRVIVLGKVPGDILFDETLGLSRDERAYGSVTRACLEARLIRALRGEP
ncbi:MAG: ABC transporter ATP-binding protein [Treponema sp.]|jgi:NitT/TauT family transport system ATP-binding protein|nr:ABC transporter ATP-binding protein [Treponema sp.]